MLHINHQGALQFVPSLPSSIELQSVACPLHGSGFPSSTTLEGTDQLAAFHVKTTEAVLAKLPST